MRKNNLLILMLAIIVSLLTLTGCKEDENTIVVGATSAPHAEILEAAKPLLEEKGYKLKIEVFEDYTAGEHYNSKTTNPSGDVWYTIYGMNDSRYDEDILDNLGVDELKRNYLVNYETGEVEFLDGPVKIDEYEINSYEDMKTLMESGVL